MGDITFKTNTFLKDKFNKFSIALLRKLIFSQLDLFLDKLGYLRLSNTFSQLAYFFQILQLVTIEPVSISKTSKLKEDKNGLFLKKKMLNVLPSNITPVKHY
jgi:hypothetical protein